jgi:DNA-binding SARP family transcriptional activator
MKKDLLAEWKHIKRIDKEGNIQSQIDVELNGYIPGSTKGRLDQVDPFILEEQRRLTKEKVETWKKLKEEEMEQKRVVEKQLQYIETRQKDEEVGRFFI